MEDHTETPSNGEHTVATLQRARKHCRYCWKWYHRGTQCPARNAVCHYCNRNGHFQAVCESKLRNKEKATVSTIASSATKGYDSELKDSIMDIEIEGTVAQRKDRSMFEKSCNGKHR
ncbi:hypothetical protein ACOME3_007116 [Neoechinorhynchus agilis]